MGIFAWVSKYFGRKEPVGWTRVSQNRYPIQPIKKIITEIMDVVLVVSLESNPFQAYRL